VVVIEVLDLLATASQSAAVQAAALGPVPSDRFAVLARHIGYPDFAAFGAFDGPTLVGFAYGSRCVPGQWWFDQISPALVANGHSAWLPDAHAVTELHVLPRYQGTGVGFRLLTTLLAGVTAPATLLSTYDNESAARRFYRRLGFRDLATGFRFEVTPQPFALMGARLPLQLTSTARPTSSVEMPQPAVEPS
jgi:ribosomal protein S18 acetylase RimI-like enzyme